MSGVSDFRRSVGSGNIVTAPSFGSGFCINDITPDQYFARLTGERVGAAYGWERVYVYANNLGAITVTKWAEDAANSGTPTNLPAIDPNGQTNLQMGQVVKIEPVEQGGTYQYVIIGVVASGFNSGSGGGAGDLTTITIGPYLTDIDVQCVTLSGSGNHQGIRVTKTWGISIVTGPDLSMIQQVYVPGSGG